MQKAYSRRYISFRNSTKRRRKKQAYRTVLEGVPLVRVMMDPVSFHPSVVEEVISVAFGTEADKLAEYINSDEKELAAEDGS
jgi:hypothetical protein